MTVKIGDIVELARLGGGRYVVSEFLGDSASQWSEVRLVRKRSDHGYASFTRPAMDLVAEPYDPFEQGENLRVHSAGEYGTFLSEDDGICRVLMPAWSKQLRGSGALNIVSSVATVSLWQLVIENRL